MTTLSRNDVDQLLNQLEGRIVGVIDRKFAEHERLEMHIYGTIVKVTDKHDEVLIGTDGNGGLKADVSKLDTSLKVLNTKIRTWYTVVSLFVGSGGLFLLYSTLTGG